MNGVALYVNQGLVSLYGKTMPISHTKKKDISCDLLTKSQE